MPVTLQNTGQDRRPPSLLRVTGDAEPDAGVVAERRPLPERYRINGTLGHGGQGVVHRCLDAVLGREVAIKQSTATTHRQAVLFANEARMTASIEHPGVLPVFDAGGDWFAMRRLRGCALSDLIDGSRWRFDNLRLAEVLIRACEAIACAHDQGIIHRDLKADNIVVGDYGETTVIDWGLAMRLDADGMLPREIDGIGVRACVGTPACMPPEAAWGDPAAVGRSTDLWMLGATLYHGITGQLPYESSVRIEDAIDRARRCDHADAAAVNPDAPPGLVRLCREAMHRDPGARPGLTGWIDGLRTWLIRSGNLPAGEAALARARRLAQLGRSSGRKNVEWMCDSYASALMSYDQAIALMPDHPSAVAERDETLNHFVTSLISCGEIILARFLQRHHRKPGQSLDARR